MPKAAIELGPLAVSRITEVGFHFVGGVPGLLLQVLPGGGRTWVLRAMVAGKRRNMGLGGYPAVTLAGAREAARRARDLIDQGIDPIAHRRTAKAILRAATLPVIVEPVMTFQAAATAYLAAHESGWSNVKTYLNWSNTMRDYAYPIIGSIDVALIDTPAVMSVLEPIWSVIPPTAAKLRSRIEDVLDWAKVEGHRTGDNPARWKGHLSFLLVSKNKIHKTVHRKAMPIEDIPNFIVQLRNFAEINGFGLTQACALEYSILTAVRPNEVRGTAHAELNLSKKLWVIPAERMKMDRPHRVPLSARAIEIVKAQPVFVGNPYVFTGARSKMYAENLVRELMKHMGLDYDPHGFRSTFRDWVAEYTNYSNEVGEMAIAHAVDTETEAAYRRGDMLEKRIALMNDWADYCNGG